MEEVKKIETEKDLELIDGELIAKFEASYGGAISSSHELKIDVVKALKVIAEKTPTDKDDKALAMAEPFVRMILDAIEKQRSKEPEQA